MSGFCDEVVVEEDKAGAVVLEEVDGTGTQTDTDRGIFPAATAAAEGPVEENPTATPADEDLDMEEILTGGN